MPPHVTAVVGWWDCILRRCDSDGIEGRNLRLVGYSITAQGQVKRGAIAQVQLFLPTVVHLDQRSIVGQQRRPLAQSYQLQRHPADGLQGNLSVLSDYPISP